MTYRWATAVAAVFVAGAAQAGITLQQGTRYEFGFDTLSRMGSSTGVNQGGFTAYLGANPLDSGERLRVELFQNVFTDPAFYTYEFTVPTTLFAATIVFPVPWQDFQGKMAFTMVAGSVDLDRLRARVIQNGKLYETDVPLGQTGGGGNAVPEPGAAVGLLTLGGALGALAIRRSVRPA